MRLDGAAAFENYFAEPLRNGLTKPKRVRGAGTKMVNMGELFANDRIHSIQMDRVPMTEREQRVALLERGDLLFARQSLVREGAGQCSIFFGDSEPTTFESHLIRARLDQAKASPLFFYYYFRSPKGRLMMDTIIEQVAAAGIRGSDLAKLPVPDLELQAQKSIAHILGTLDDKIELNRRMNRTLEANARAIFKSWFIDFLPVRAKIAARTQTGDPVHAKAEGLEPIGMDPDTAALFPDSFQDSPLGKIPKGWEVGNLGGIAARRQQKIKPEQIEEGTPYVALDDIPRRSIALDSWKAAEGIASAKSCFLKGNILFGKLRPYFHKVVVAPLDGICSTDIIVLGPIEEACSNYLLMICSSAEFVAYNSAVMTGTKMPRTNWRDMSRYELVLPSKGLLVAYQSFAQALVDQMIRGIAESRQIAAVRDALLPLLLSGELSEEALP